MRQSYELHSKYYFPVKTLPKFFPIENKRLTKNCFLIGNDLETSEVPYLTLFCIKSKERWLQMQR